MSQHPNSTYPKRRSRYWFLLVFFLLLLVVVFSFAVVRRIRSEHRKLVLLRRQIQIAAAPGECIVLDDRALAWGVGHAGTSTLNTEITLLRSDAQPEQVMSGHSEIVLVVQEGDPLAARLRAAGYRTEPDQMALPVNVLGRRCVEIFFVVPTQAVDSTSKQ